MPEAGGRTTMALVYVHCPECQSIDVVQYGKQANGTQRYRCNNRDCPRTIFLFHSVFKFFQVAITGIVRMTSYARYFKEGVGSSRPNWRWIMCFLEWPKANTWCNACVKLLSFS